jgi:hypothetical protein
MAALAEREGIDPELWRYFVEAMRSVERVSRERGES